MEWSTLLFMSLGLLLVLLASGMRIFAVLALVGIIVLWLGMGWGAQKVLAYGLWNTVLSFPMAAMPLFIFMGEIIYQCGLSHRVYNAIAPIANRLPGGLLHTNVVAGAVFAAASGSVVASTATIGKISLHDMDKMGYDRSIAMGSVAAGGCLGILIPPSITMIIYGVMTLQSIGQLFIAGILPGIMLTILFMIYIAVRVIIQPHLAPSKGEAMPWGSSLVKALGAWPILLLSVLILGSIYVGIATPTEVAGMGAFFAMLIAAAYRTLTWSAFKAATAGAVKVTCYAMLIFVGAKIMGSLLANLGVFHELSKWVVALPVPEVGILIAVIIMYLILGMFMSGLPAIIITLPITFPIVVTALGYDPIWFGILIVLLNECGQLTPPVGTVLYILIGLRPDIPFRQAAMGVIPFVLVILVAITIIVMFPQIALWLPSHMF